MSTKATKIETYELLAGDTLEFPAPPPPVAAFIRRAQSAAKDRSVSVDHLIELIYGRENPVLDQTIFPTRGAVTKAVLADPLYHLMLDLLDRKRVQAGTLDPEKAAARYTVTVPEAARTLGVHESAVRQAIAAHRLSSWKRGARHFLDPNEVANYRPAPHGPPPALQVVVGSKPGSSFAVKVQGGEFKREEASGSAGTPERQAVHGTITNWTRVAIIGRTKTGARCWIVEPGELAEEIPFQGFHVKGRFRVVEQINNEQRARDTFRTFKGDA